MYVCTCMCVCTVLQKLWNLLDISKAANSRIEWRAWRFPAGMCQLSLCGVGSHCIVQICNIHLTCRSWGNFFWNSTTTNKCMVNVKERTMHDVQDLKMKWWPFLCRFSDQQDPQAPRGVIDCKNLPRVTSHQQQLTYVPPRAHPSLMSTSSSSKRYGMSASAGIVGIVRSVYSVHVLNFFL